MLIFYGGPKIIILLTSVWAHWLITRNFGETVKPFSSGNLLKIAYLVDHETISLAKLGRNLLPLTDESLTVKKSTLIF